MHHPTDRIAHTTAFFYTSRGALAGTKEEEEERKKQVKIQKQLNKNGLLTLQRTSFPTLFSFRDSSIS